MSGAKHRSPKPRRLRRFQQAIDIGTPAAIIEAGYLTSDEDRALLTRRPEVAARCLANGILDFLALNLGS